MTASTNRDEDSYIPKDKGSREATGFVYDDPNSPPSEIESTYTPEREFVLMPLFRRIGELLGVRQRQELEYYYEAAREAPPGEASPVHGEASLSHDELAHDELGKTPLPDPVPAAELADVNPEFVTLQASESQLEAERPALEVPEQIAGPTAHFEQLPEPVAAPTVPMEAELQSPAYEPLVQEDAGGSFEKELQCESVAEAQAAQTAALVGGAAVSKSAQPQRQKIAPRRKDEIDEAIALLREAASKVSTAISETVEWVSAKEAELVRKAERSLAPAPRTRKIQPTPAARSAMAKEPVPSPSSTPVPDAATAGGAHADTPPSPAVPKWEPLQFPALQREVIWKEQAGSSATGQQAVSNGQSIRSTTNPVKHRPALVRPRPRVPFWKRIDWAEEFTPKRVAVLGGVMMAMLLVAGVTLARRPVSEVLPPQPRPIQPGGVTLSTHPAVTKSPILQSPRTAAPAHPAATAPHRAKRAVAYDSEPDVVTHYYKSKPSPSKQATVAGVKHYSDME